MNFFITLPEYEKELFLNKKNKITEFDTPRAVLEKANEILKNVTSFDNDILFAALTPISEELSLKTGAVMWCIRIAVSGMSATPGGATEIMEVIGKEESISRIATALNKLNWIWDATYLRVAQVFELELPSFLFSTVVHIYSCDTQYLFYILIILKIYGKMYR